jgi:hypothetical protein
MGAPSPARIWRRARLPLLPALLESLDSLLRGGSEDGEGGQVRRPISLSPTPGARISGRLRLRLPQAPPTMSRHSSPPRSSSNVGTRSSGGNHPSSPACCFTAGQIHHADPPPASVAATPSRGRRWQTGGPQAAVHSPSRSSEPLPPQSCSLPFAPMVGKSPTCACFALDPAAVATDYCPSQPTGRTGGHDDRRGLEATLHRLPQRAEGSLGQELGRAAHPSRQVLRPHQRQALQAGRIFRSTHEVCPRQEGKDILEEIHKGVCGNHASSRTLVSKAFRRAFYWPTALGDAKELFRRC